MWSEGRFFPSTRIEPMVQFKRNFSEVLKAKNMFHASLQALSTPDDNSICDPQHRLRRQQQLEGLFTDDPNKDFAIQSAYVNTSDFGVVTVVRRKAPLANGPDTYSIGINTTNQDWPSLHYNFDRDLAPGPLSLVNAAGRVAGIVAYTKTPSAIELLDAVVSSVTRSLSSLSYQIPHQPNLNYCSFR